MGKHEGLPLDRNFDTVGRHRLPKSDNPDMELNYVLDELDIDLPEMYDDTDPEERVSAYVTRLGELSIWRGDNEVRVQVDDQPGRPPRIANRDAIEDVIHTDSIS